MELIHLTKTPHETVYLGHDNTIELRLTIGVVLADITASTKVTTEFGNTVISSISSPDAFDWEQGDGMLYLKLGDENIPIGSYHTILTIYDATNTKGIVWGTFKCKVE